MDWAVTPEAIAEWQRIFDCWNGGDFDDMLEMYADDAVFDVSAVFSDIAPARGHTDIRRTWSAMFESLEGLRMDPVEFHSLGSGRYAAEMRLWGKGVQSGAAIDRRYGCHWTFGADGKCLRVQLLPDLASAMTFSATSALR